MRTKKSKYKPGQLLKIKGLGIGEYLRKDEDSDDLFVHFEDAVEEDDELQWIDPSRVEYALSPKQKAKFIKQREDEEDEDEDWEQGACFLYPTASALSFVV